VSSGCPSGTYKLNLDYYYPPAFQYVTLAYALDPIPPATLHASYTCANGSWQVQLLRNTGGSWVSVLGPHQATITC
jgi:hypothetical protein